jgi:hypothetical protein|tara:strand:+ start:237 stop:419 length:183 start_codon:yes stop_codon:yes gene_type:complete
VKQVNHRHITIPANWTSPKKNESGIDFEDIPGVVIKNYHTLEGAGEEFVNSYDEEQFIRP